MSAVRKMSKEKRDRIKKALISDPHISQPIVAKRFGVSTTTIYKINRELKKENKNNG